MWKISYNISSISYKIRSPEYKFYKVLNKQSKRQIKMKISTMNAMKAINMNTGKSVKCVLILLLCTGLVDQLHAETEQPFLSEDQGKFRI